MKVPNLRPPSKEGYYWTEEVTTNSLREIVLFREGQIWSCGDERPLDPKYYQNFVGPLKEVSDESK